MIPGESYRLELIVDVTDNAPGTEVGILEYGDETDFTVDLWYDTYVVLTVQPSRSLVFDNQIRGNKIRAYRPATDTQQAGWQEWTVSGFTASPADKFFYTSSGRLNYFNQSANRVYQWPNLSQELRTSDSSLDGNHNALGLTISAVTEDALAENGLVLVGRDSSQNVIVQHVDLSLGLANPSVSNSYDITADLDAYAPGASDIRVTGVASDLLGDVFVSFVGTYTNEFDEPWAVSGILAYYYGSWYATYPGGGLELYNNENGGVITDLMFARGRLMALISPNTNFGADTWTHNTGRADILVMDDWLTPIIDDPSPAARYYTAAPTAGAYLYLPNKFAGVPQGRFVYLNQQDFNNPSGTVNLSQLNLDTFAVSNLVQP